MCLSIIDYHFNANIVHTIYYDLRDLLVHGDVHHDNRVDHNSNVNGHPVDKVEQYHLYM